MPLTHTGVSRDGLWIGRAQVGGDQPRGGQPTRPAPRKEVKQTREDGFKELTSGMLLVCLRHGDIVSFLAASVSMFISYFPFFLELCLQGLLGLY